MVIDLGVAIVVWSIGFAVFGRFIAPRWKVLGKLVFYLSVSTLLSWWIQHWSLLWIVGHPLLGLAGHFLVVPNEWNTLDYLPASRSLSSTATLGLT